MAISLGIFSTLFAGETVTSLKSPATRMTVYGSHPAQANVRNVWKPICVASASATPNPATETKKTREPRGITKPRRVSPEMEAVVGVSVIPRTQALKQIWAYIKENNLQDPENKKEIICDEKLKKIFKGNERVGFLQIAGLISDHFL